MTIFIISERNLNNNVAWGNNCEFEDIIASTYDAKIVAPKGCPNVLH